MVGIRSLGWCITLSLVYSVGSYLAAGVTGTPGAFGQVTLMDVRWSPAWAPSWLPRLLVAAVIAGLGVFSFWYYSSGWIHRFPEWMVERLDWGREGAALATATFVAFCVVPGGLLAVAVVVAVVVAGFGAGAGIVAGAGAGLLAGAGAGTAAGAGRNRSRSRRRRGQTDRAALLARHAVHQWLARLDLTECQ